MGDVGDVGIGISALRGKEGGVCEEGEGVHQGQ